MDGLDEGPRERVTSRTPGSRSSAPARWSPAEQKTVTDGPFAEAKDLVGGYTLVEASDLAQAAELTSGCPILEIGGSVEVRPIMKMGHVVELGDHLFRHEAGRMVAALTRIFGVHNLALAEDVVQDAFCRALEVWKFRGVPDNPSAWLMATARHRAIDVLRRERTARTFAPELGRLLESEWTLVPVVEELFDAAAVKDDLLRMMFSCCHPRLSEEAQVALVLHILCGFSVGEIAAAFLEHATRRRRSGSSRAKKVLAAIEAAVRSGGRRVLRAPVGRPARALPALQRGLPRRIVRSRRCASSCATRRCGCRRCCSSIRSRDAGDVRAGGADVLNAARLPARVDEAGDLQLAVRSGSIAVGSRRSSRKDSGCSTASATGPELTEYHVEAAIAAVHANARRAEDTDWGQIVALYDTLMRMRPSPVVALNRAIAVGAARRAGARARGDSTRSPTAIGWRGYPFYFAALGELELRLRAARRRRAQHFRQRCRAGAQPDGAAVLRAAGQRLRVVGAGRAGERQVRANSEFWSIRLASRAQCVMP